MYLNWFSLISSEVLIFGFNNGCIALFDDVCKEVVWEISTEFRVAR